jgi:hypothetical protein
MRLGTLVGAAVMIAAGLGLASGQAAASQRRSLATPACISDASAAPFSVGFYGEPYCFVSYYYPYFGSYALTSYGYGRPWSP